MKQILAGILGIGFLVFSGVFFSHAPKKTPSGVSVTARKASPTVTLTPIDKPAATTKILFVPYWTLDHDIALQDYTSLVYFGIQPTKDGIDTSDQGYKTMSTFLQVTTGAKKRLLAIRMINTDINNAVLTNPQAQKTIIKQAVQIAKENGFNGIVLDFEISALAFDSVVKNITSFTTSFSQTVHTNGLSFYITPYGDTFYHIRPFDMKALSGVSDGIIIMAYDFHKAKGDAGPNFPLQGKTIYGYDMETMVDDFLHYINPGKVTVIFGMYGYDWPIDNKRQTIDTATSITNLQAKRKFMTSCSLKNCQVRRDDLSTETEVTYTDGNNKNHDVWFDDMISTQKKAAFLQSKGITSIGYWAYGYF